MAILSTQLMATPLPTEGRKLSFEDRVEAQRAIEQLYWNRRIWPKDNPGQKPALSEVMSETALRAKVEDYLKKLTALDKWWKRPIAPEQLQAEIRRIATQTNAPEFLAQLFAALGNDPALIAETLGRQRLVDRLLSNWYAYDKRFHGEVRRRAETALAAGKSVSELMPRTGEYRETTWRLARTTNSDRASATKLLDGIHSTVDLDPKEWAVRMRELADSFDAEPEAIPQNRLSKLEETPEAFVVFQVLSATPDTITTASATWRKVAFGTWWSAEREKLGTTVPGAIGTYERVPLSGGTCEDDTWREVFDENVPSGRAHATSIWTGTEMIVWGGAGYYSTSDIGGRYDPATDTWSEVSAGPGAASARGGHSMIWTGTEVILWGEAAEPLGTLVNGTTLQQTHGERR